MGIWWECQGASHRSLLTIQYPQTRVQLLADQLPNNSNHHSDCQELLFEAPNLLLSQSSAEMCLMGSSSPDPFYPIWPRMLRQFQQWTHSLVVNARKKEIINHLEMVCFGLERETGASRARAVGKAQRFDFIPSHPPWQQLGYRWTPVSTAGGGHIHHLTAFTLSTVHKENNQPLGGVLHM